MSDPNPTPPRSNGVTGLFPLNLGTTEEPRRLSVALAELRRHLDKAKIRTWAYADQLWADDAQSIVNVIFPDTKSAETAKKGW